MIGMKVELSGSVHVLLAVMVFEKNPVNVFATFRSQNIHERNVLSHDTVWVDARIISPPPPSVSILS